MDAYDPNIDYRNLLTRFIKYLYKNWISNPEIAARYPHMVKHSPVIEYVKKESVYPWGGTISSLCAAGDVRNCYAPCKPDENETYYDMLKRALVCGIGIKTSNDVRTSSITFLSCDWSASEMGRKLDEMGII